MQLLKSMWDPEGETGTEKGHLGKKLEKWKEIYNLANGIVSMFLDLNIK
jgi:hypothetical protein